MADRKSHRVTTEKPDRSSRASQLLARALELFEGDRDAATQWLLRPLPALGGATPFETAGTELGVQQVIILVGRIEHGVYS